MSLKCHHALDVSNSHRPRSPYQSHCRQPSYVCYPNIYGPVVQRLVQEWRGSSPAFHVSTPSTHPSNATMCRHGATTYRRHPSLEIGKNDITPLSHTSTSWPLVDLADHLVGIPYFKLLKTCMIPTALNHSLFPTSPSHPPPWSPTRDLLA